jgi:hypothetical protein
MPYRLTECKRMFATLLFGVNGFRVDAPRGAVALPTEIKVAKTNA